jgi:hypothetical protein
MILLWSRSLPVVTLTPYFFFSPLLSYSCAAIMLAMMVAELLTLFLGMAPTRIILNVKVGLVFLCFLFAIAGQTNYSINCWNSIRDHYTKYFQDIIKKNSANMAPGMTMSLVIKPLFGPSFYCPIIAIVLSAILIPVLLCCVSTANPVPQAQTRAGSPAAAGMAPPAPAPPVAIAQPIPPPKM